MDRQYHLKCFPMKIDGFGSIGSTSGTSKRKGVSTAGNFAELLAASEDTAEANQTAAASDVIAPAAMSSLLALQEVPEEYLNRKKLLQQGNNMLDTLDKLHRQLLMGPITFQTLRNIEQEIATQKQAVDDPKLLEIISEIELRAAVEAAKLRQYMKNTW